MAIAAAGLLSLGGLSAKADFLDIDLTGWQAWEGYGDHGDTLNSGVLLSFAPGTAITGYDFINLSFTANSPSWRSDLVLSVNNLNYEDGYMDFEPSLLNSAGTFGPASGSWIVGDQAAGAPFTVSADGVLWITVYDLFADGASPDEIITSGTLRINYTPTPVPEPTTATLVGLGLLGLGFWRKNMRR